MASLMIHQIVGEEYCKIHRVDDEHSFLAGNLAPDLTDDKSISHFSKKRIGNKTYTESIQNKLNLPAFCEKVGIDNDFSRGVFLHLLTDHIFFVEYLLNLKEYQDIEHLNQLTIRDILYRDYHRINKWIMNSHPNIMLEKLPEDAKTTRDDQTEVLAIDDIRRLIKICANLDLDRSYNYFLPEKASSKEA